MSIRRFEKQMGARESVEKNLKAHGYESPQEVIDSLNGTRDQVEDVLEGKDISALLKFIGEERKKKDDRAIESFRATSDSIERLEILRTLSIPDMIRCIKNNSYNEAQWRYLEGRLDFYQKLIQWKKVTRKQTEQKWDSKKGEYINVVKEYQLDASNSTPETIRLGMWRDVLYAAMQGTPEMGAIKIATKRINQGLIKKASKSSSQATKIKSAVELFGYYSGIQNGFLGQYDDLGDLYKKCLTYVQRKYEKNKLTDEQLEHKAVLSLAKKLEGAYEYHGIVDVSLSPYSAGFKEAISAGQLGHKVMRQMRGMRNKIQETNFEHIDRFIGKSGYNRYAPEKKELDTDVEALKEYLGIAYSGYDYTLGDQKLTGKEAAQAFVEQKNGFAIQKQQGWIERETESLNHKFEKSKAEIEKANLPEEEKDLQLQSVTERHENAIASIQIDYQAEVARLQERTLEQLLTDLEQRQVVVNERYEKRKSLAQKALDLHFRINHAGANYGSKPLSGLVDWINYAPLGTIKRAHKMLRQGAEEDQITTYALVDIIAGNRGATREDVRIIQGLVQKAKGQDYAARQKLVGMSKVGNIVSRFDYEVSLADVEDMASKGFHGMTETLKLYDLEQVRQLMDQGVNLHSVTTVRNVTQKFGHDLSTVEVAELASHNIDGLEEAMRSFDLTAVKTLLSQDVSLPTAVAVLNNTKQFGYELSVSQIAKVAKNVRDINDFTEALRGFPLEEVEKLFATGITYQDFGVVKLALEKHGLNSDFPSSLTIAQKLAKNSEYSNLDGALEFYSMEEIEQIITSGAPLDGMLKIRQVLEEKQITTNLKETILFVKSCDRNYWNFAQCIDTFGIENIRKMTIKSCRFDKALEVNNYINGESRRSRYGGESENEMPDSTLEALRKGGIDVIIAITKAGSIEVAVKTLAAGFTVEEVTRFPYLISSLVAKP